MAKDFEGRHGFAGASRVAVAVRGEPCSDGEPSGEMIGNGGLGGPLGTPHVG
jgi:hypothetical protein